MKLLYFCLVALFAPFADFKLRMMEPFIHTQLVAATSYHIYHVSIRCGLYMVGNVWYNGRKVLVHYWHVCWFDSQLIVLTEKSKTD